MTGPGPIPTGGIPDVKPLYFAQTPGLAQALGPQVQLLLSVLEANQAKKERGDKIALDRLAGGVLRDTLVAADTDLIPAPGNAAFTAMGMPGVQPFAPVQAEGPLARTLKGAPGEAVMAAAPYLTGIVAGTQARRTNREQAYMDAQAERAKALAQQGKPELHWATNEKGFLYRFNDGRAELMRDERGQPFKVKGEATGPLPGKTPYIDVRPSSPTYRQIVPLSDGQVIDPNSFVALQDARAQDAKEAADFYPQMMTAFQQARNGHPLSQEDAGRLSVFIGTMGRAKADVGALNLLVADKTLSPDTRRWLNSMLDMAGALIYKKSGKAVTAGEFTRFVASGIPLPWEDEQTQEEKWARLEQQIEGASGASRGSLILRGQQVEPFAEVRDRARTERAKRAELQRHAREVLMEHPDWSPAKVAAEAQRRYNAPRPAGAKP